MKIVVLASSSAGNSTYVEIGNKKFLIDAGLAFGVMKDKLYDLNVTLEELDFIIVTHAHSDHVRSLHSFNRVYNTKILISRETFKEYSKRDCIKNYEFLENIEYVDELRIIKIPISHDKKGFGFVFEYKSESIAYMADTGMIHNKYHNYLKNRNVYLFESNHDVEMEMNGTKDQMTKLRNIGDMGHLSNEDCAKYLSLFVGDKTKVIVLIHISEHDNTYEKAYNVNRNIIDKNIKIILSDKTNSSEIIEL